MRLEHTQSLSNIVSETQGKRDRYLADQNSTSSASNNSSSSSTTQVTQSWVQWLGDRLGYRDVVLGARIHDKCRQGGSDARLLHLARLEELDFFVGQLPLIALHHWIIQRRIRLRVEALDEKDFARNGDRHQSNNALIQYVQQFNSPTAVERKKYKTQMQVIFEQLWSSVQPLMAERVGGLRLNKYMIELQQHIFGMCRAADKASEAGSDSPAGRQFWLSILWRNVYRMDHKTDKVTALRLMHYLMSNLDLVEQLSEEEFESRNWQWDMSAFDLELTPEEQALAEDKDWSAFEAVVVEPRDAIEEINSSIRGGK